MSQFAVAVAMVLALEGGLVEHPYDPGGTTKYGISQRAYPDLDIASLTVEEAKQIYFDDYWTPVADVVQDPRMRIMVFDSAVNHGLYRALVWYEADPDFNDYLAHRLNFYTNLEGWEQFGRGWTRRVGTVVTVANNYARDQQFADALIDNRPWYERLLAAFTGRSGPIRYRVRPLTDGAGMKLDVDSA